MTKRRSQSQRKAKRKLEWVVPFIDPQAAKRLNVALDIAASEFSKSRFVGDIAAERVDMFRGFKVEVFSNEHAPPHFRVKYAGETANYQISDCTQINGGLARYFNTIREWHAKNKQKLIETWDKRRPTDCPVGKYREA
jgi:type I restriction enzyme, R subunit